MSSDRSPPPVSPALPAGVDEPEIPRGEAIGRHVVIGVVGRGATGTVYKAFDTHLSRQLAIKILHREHAWGEGGDPIELRMRREAQAMARLNHPNVVTVHDVGASTTIASSSRWSSSTEARSRAKLARRRPSLAGAPQGRRVGRARPRRGARGGARAS